jgi:hypothetical protein
MNLRALFRRDSTEMDAAQDRAERRLAESLRLLGLAFTKMAEVVESQRLTRSGYAEPGRFLERSEDGAASRPGGKSGPGDID